MFLDHFEFVFAEAVSCDFTKSETWRREGELFYSKGIKTGGLLLNWDHAIQ